MAIKFAPKEPVKSVPAKEAVPVPRQKPVNDTPAEAPEQETKPAKGSDLFGSEPRAPGRKTKAR